MSRLDIDQAMTEFKKQWDAAIASAGEVWRTPIIGPPAHIHIPEDKIAMFEQPIEVRLDHDHHCGCKHDWKKYVGLTEAYKYCTKCPEKRSLDEQ